ncbi:oxalate decarboxylase family bicupin [Phanerochaete sordida]|uniref:Oxalate decarboxylase family bicupin n=1 Tax=Phanerochaete sordida TaxID=48140 RepID=A0A9P3LAA1_9APHY|nr:oxalate decarboxylase family bicupin [Phanerochaete sordida]
MSLKTLLASVTCAVLLGSLGSAAPAGSSSSSASSLLSPSSTAWPSSGAPSSTDSAPPVFETVPPASDDPNDVAWPPSFMGTPEAIRGSLGATVIGPQNVPLDLENPDLLAPPTTDNGLVDNAKWPFSLSHNRLQTGGWARQQNINQLPAADELAGVDMRLEKGAIRELHWHTASEWAYVTKGSVQVTAVNQLGQNFVGTANQGDLWFFPAGVPHSLQATNATEDGSEFLLVFDNGSFDEDGTFLITDWLAHTPKEVIAKNFQAPISVFNELPGEELYIFPAAPPGPDSDRPESPYGEVPSPYTYAMSQMPATQLSGGSVKIVDSHTFNISKTTAVAEVTVNPGAMRELHWHPTQDEWTYFLEGNARVTVFASQGNANTFDFQGGDIGYIPASHGHYVENTGNTTLRFLEVFKTATFQDVSLSQWLALTPAAMVEDTLNLKPGDLKYLSKVKQVVVGPAPVNGTANSTYSA